MKKTYQLTIAALMTATAMSAAAPSGDLYVLGINGETSTSAANKLELCERTPDDIDEGFWKWQLSSIEISKEEGSLTIGDGKSLSLGYDASSEFNTENMLTSTLSMVYMAEKGAAVNYNLPAGEYNLSVVLFEDIDGESGGDTWMLQLKSNSPIETEGKYYLLGFNGIEEAGSAVCFKKEAIEDEGEVSYIYTLSKFEVKDCAAGFTVYSSLTDESLGLDPDFAATTPAVTAESPMAFLKAGGEKVKFELPAGFYDVSFTSMGAMSMITFTASADNTPLEEMEYYLLGVNGIDSPVDGVKFKRDVVTTEYEDEGEIIKETTIQYSLKGFDYADAPEGMVVASADGSVEYGFDSEMEVFLPNNLSTENPFAMMAVGGQPLKSSLPAGKYDITFTITDFRTATITFITPEEGAVDEIEADDAPAVYYDLNGMRVKNPTKGIFIMIKGSNTRKIVR